MRWLPYFILAYLTLGVQIGLGDFVSWHGARPNLVLIAVLFVALNAPRDAALLGCFVMGAIQDLVTQQPPGLFALSYGLTALVVVGSHHVVNREHFLTYFGLALVGGLLTATVLLVHAWIHPGIPRGPGGASGATTLPAVRLSAGTELTRAIYTAVLAPVVLSLLHRTKRFFAFQPQRRKGRPW